MGTRICARSCMGKNHLELMVVLFTNAFSTFGLPRTTVGIHCIAGWAKASHDITFSRSLLHRSLSSYVLIISGHFWKYLEYLCFGKTTLNCGRILNSHIRELGACDTCCSIAHNLSGHDMGMYYYMMITCFVQMQHTHVHDAPVPNIYTI